MPGWKARIGILSPSVFEAPPDWDLILPSGFKPVASGLNVRGRTAEEFDRAIEALEAALSVFAAEEADAVLPGGITLTTQTFLSQRTELRVAAAMEANAEALQHL